MDEQLIRQIDELIDADRANIAADVIRLVNIRSVREAPLPGAPFGEGPQRLLEEVMALGADRGFVTRDYGTGVVSLSPDEGEIDLGIWAHGDVVHEGIGWNYDPYNAVEYKGCIIGRGATDNKGQLVAILRLLEIFKKLGISLRYNPALFVGSNEETAMAEVHNTPEKADVKAFLRNNPAPRLSLVPDSGFPVGYGGKGCVRARIIAKTPWDGVRLEAGKDDSPGKAEAWIPMGEFTDTADCTVERCADGTLKLTANTAPVHCAHPKADGNMITVITDAMLSSGTLSEGDRKKAEFLRAVSTDVCGELFGIDCRSGTMGNLTLAMVDVRHVNGRPEMGINIRYPIETDYESIRRGLERVSGLHGFEIAGIQAGTEPYLLDRDWDVIDELTRISNEVCGADSRPYTVGGGTYAHVLPNALVYGMNGCLPPDDFEPGYGGAHGKDESVSLDRLQRGMRIYARALLKLNEMEW
ncbi:MAG: Sapep family Mn(2+)-dependent dipeptidase [Clostridia bacterium]|nr:Sapep family Mn(2+)-dependent dipeptidase [Clostridia bacterium]